MGPRPRIWAYVRGILHPAFGVFDDLGCGSGSCNINGCATRISFVSGLTFIVAEVSELLRLTLDGVDVATGWALLIEDVHELDGSTVKSIGCKSRREFIVKTMY